jgi:hypothetical protein
MAMSEVMTMRCTFPIPSLLVVLCAALVVPGCMAYKLERPPPGFAFVDDDSDRMKSGDDVGINIAAFGNVRGGTLAFWSEDMVEKLGRRGYTLVEQTPVRSKNGVVGTRFDFSYTPPPDGDRKFYTAVLFVTDRYRVVVQLAGDAPLADKHSPTADRLARRIRIRGCRGRDICRGPQPGKLATAAAGSTDTDGPDKR